MSGVLAFLPVHDQEDQIEWVLDRFGAVVEGGTVDEVVAVDDGSTDRSAALIEGCEHCSLIRNTTRRGIGSSIQSAYRYALDNGYDVFVVMAGNGKDDPAETARVLEPIRSGKADYVQGSRFAPGGVSQGLPRHRQVAIRLFTWTFSLLVGHRFTDCTNGFRAYRTSILRDSRVDWSQDWLGSYELEYYVHYKAVQLGYRVAEVPVSKVYRHPSADGSYSKMRARDWLVALKPLFYLRLGLRH